ncbi:DUF3348 family protein, partial [Streptomyces mirabilis]|uniref:DUF3348 family protein n=1 Tax=Streptomyces mirabilis TaxID=68239 RepID=UPI003679A21F
MRKRGRAPAGRAARPPAPHAAAGDDAPVPEAWLQPFRRDMHDALLAELDVSLQP